MHNAAFIRRLVCILLSLLAHSIDIDKSTGTMDNLKHPLKIRFFEQARGVYNTDYLTGARGI